MIINKIKRLTLILMIVALVFSTQFINTPNTSAHHAVLQFNLEEMVATSDRIFIGRCTDIKESVEMIAQGELPVTSYTFAVSEKIKGSIGSTVTFKQLGHRAHKPTGKTLEPLIGGVVADPKNYIHGMTYYVVGEEMMLMLIPDYLENLTYPVGMYQGAFSISRTASGKGQIKNAINNRGLFTNLYTNYRKSTSQARVIHPDYDQPILDAKLSPQTATNLLSKPGALPVDDFVSLVRTIVESEK